MIADDVKMNWKTICLILTKEFELRKICAKLVPIKLAEEQQDAQLSVVFDIQMQYGDAAASLLTQSRTLQVPFISES
jgi:hypothetical protein